MTIIGPILSRSGAYVFDTWAPNEGERQSFPYRRIEEAIYARNSEIRTAQAMACATVDEFLVNISA